MKRAFAACLLLLSPWLSGYTQACPGGVAISGEWLYMHPSYSQPYYVIDSSTTSVPIGSRIANDASYHSGYRLEALYAFCLCPNDVRLRWTHFPSFTERDSTSGAALFSVLSNPDTSIEGLPGTFSMRDTFEFYMLDLVFTQPFVECGPFHFDVQAGVTYGYLDLRERAFFNRATSTDRITSMHSQRWGIGPEIGYEFTYCLPCNLTLTGRGYVGALVSQRESSYYDANLTQAGAVSKVNADTKNREYWDLMPLSDLRFGLSYTGCLGFLYGFPFDVEVGYELLTLYRGLDRQFYPDANGDGASSDHLMNFSLHGPYVHVGLTF